MVNDLREDLDRALRTVTFSEAPVERAKRDGRRRRARRRLGVLAGALAVAAVAAGYPALTGSGAAVTPAPAPATGTVKPTAWPDPTITAGLPKGTTQAAGGLTDKTGAVAAGTVGGLRWELTVVPPGTKNPVPADSCYTVALSFGGPSLTGNPVTGRCYDLPDDLAGILTSSGYPAVFTGMTDGTNDLTIGEVAPDVTYLTVAFADGQQLKLIPVTAGFRRYVAWLAPLSATVIDVIAHLGGPYHDNGQTASTAPFDLTGQLPLYGLWQAEGVPAPPRDSRVIGSGTAGGQAWKVTAYEGPWGTCFVTGANGSFCVPVKQLNTTQVLGGWGGNPPDPGTSGSAVFGSAAPGVALVKVKLSNGTTATARPAGVGNEDLFAFPVGKGVSPVSWTAYDGSGKQVAASASVKPGAAGNSPVPPSS